MGLIRRTIKPKVTAEKPKQIIRKVFLAKTPPPLEPKKPRTVDPDAPLSATSVTSKRKAQKPKPNVPEFATANDYIGTYIQSLPEEPIPYRELVQQYILPQTHTPMFVFGKELRITPSYVSTLNGCVKIVGILVEVDVGQRGMKDFRVKKRINGTRTLWYSQIKYLVKLAME